MDVIRYLKKLLDHLETFADIQVSVVLEERNFHLGYGQK